MGGLVAFWQDTYHHRIAIVTLFRNKHNTNLNLTFVRTFLPHPFTRHSMGSVLLVVYGAQLAWEAAPRYRGLITFMGILLITTGSCKTISRNRDWYSRETLLR